MAQMIPYIHSSDARKQSDFYVRAFDGEIVTTATYGQFGNASEEVKDLLAHIAVKAGDLQIYLNDHHEQFGPLQNGQNIELAVEFPSGAEAQQVFDRLTEGGKVVSPFGAAPWGGLWGVVQDPFGIGWMISAPQ